MKSTMKGIIMMLIGTVLTGVSVHAADFEKDQFTTQSGKTIEITFIKHGTLMISYDGRIIQIDPVSMYADYTQMPKADVILVTHEHGDHLDLKAIGDLEKQGTIIVSNNVSYEKIQKGDVMKNGDKQQVTPYLYVEAVPAYNTTEGRERYHPKGQENGYILTLDNMRIYVAADTEDIPELKELKNIDIAFLPVNQPYTMTVPQAAHAAKMFNPRILYPYHYGETNIEELKTALEDTPEIDVRIRQMQ